MMLSSIKIVIVMRIITIIIVIMKSTETQPSCTVCGDRHAATQCDTVQSLNTLNTIVWENIKYHFAVTI